MKGHDCFTGVKIKFLDVSAYSEYFDSNISIFLTKT